MVVIYFSLTPLRGEGETERHKAKAHDHIPGTDMRDWVLGSADVIDDDPNQANDKCPDHRWR
jgi:hypothetical protein